MDRVGSIVVRSAWRITVVALATGAVACSSSGPGRTTARCDVLQLPSTGPGDVEELFPITVGSTWAYTATDSRSPASQRFSVTSSAVAGGSVFTLAHLDDPAEPDLVTVYAKTAAGVTITSDPSLPAPFDGYAHPWLAFPITAGRTTQPIRCTNIDSGSDLDGDGRNETADLDMQVSVVGDEVQTVPAGTFTARRIETRITYTIHASTGPSASGSVTELDWLAPGIGLVRQSVTAVAPGTSFTGDAQLTGFSVGTRRGGIVPHAAIATHIAPGWSDGAEERVALSSGGGGLLATWRQPGTYFGQDAVRAAFVDPSAGQPATPFDVVDSPGSSGHPAIAFDGNNHLVVSALCVGTTGCGRIVGQRLSPAGARLDGNGGFTVVADGSAVYDPAVAGGAGGWLVAWTRYGEGLYVTPVSASGQVGAARLLRANPLANMGSVAVGVAYAAGTYLVAWTEGAWSGSMTLYASRVSPEGLALDAEPIAISTAPGTRSVATVVSDGTRFHVVSLDARSGVVVPGAGYPLPDVYVARVATDGTLVDGPAVTGGILVNGYQSASASGVPSSKRAPAALWDGRQLVVSWWVDAYGPPGGIYVARVTGDGSALDSPLGTGVLVARGIGTDRLANPSLGTLPGGSTLAAWLTVTGKDVDAATLYW